MEFTWWGNTSGDVCSPRVIDNYSFVYVVTGKGVFHLHGDVIDLQQGDLFTLFPHELHAYYPNPVSPWSLAWFGVKGKDVDDLIRKTGISNQLPVLKIPETAAVYELISSIISELDKKDVPAELFAVSCLYRLLGKMAQYLRTPFAEKQLQPSAQIEKCVRFINLNYAHALNCDILADYSGYTRTYFSNLFKQHTGKSPILYLTEIRLKQASYLLKTTGLPVQEVSRSVGYQDPFYFSRLFKKHFGISPSELS